MNKKIKSCIANTSPLIWLERINYSYLLPELYEKIYAPYKVDRELSPEWKNKSFIWKHIEVPRMSEEEKRDFDKLVENWYRRLKLYDEADVQVLVLYKKLKADEMLFANKEAETKCKKYGRTRDIMQLYELAEEKAIFSREDSIKYLDKLLEIKYRTPEVKMLKKRLSKRT